MMNNIVALGYGIIIFAILIGVGSLVLYQFGGTTGCLTPGYSYWNNSNNRCEDYASGTVNHSNYTDPAGTTYTNVAYMNTQLGSSGLAGWTPAIIAVSVGLLFLGAFMIGKGNQTRRY